MQPCEIHDGPTPRQACSEPKSINLYDDKVFSACRSFGVAARAKARNTAVVAIE